MMENNRFYDMCESKNCDNFAVYEITLLKEKYNLCEKCFKLLTTKLRYSKDNKESKQTKLIKDYTPKLYKFREHTLVREE